MPVCKSTFAACCATLLLSTTALAEPAVLDTRSNEDHAAMQAQLEGVIAAYNAGDPAAFKAAYTEDAWVISMRRPIEASREAIGAAFTPGMAQYQFTTALRVLDVEVHGDIAYMIGRSTLTGAPREGTTVPAFVEERIYTAIFKRVDGEWLIHRHMESTSPVALPDNPAAE